MTLCGVVESILSDRVQWKSRSRTHVDDSEINCLKNIVNEYNGFLTSPRVTKSPLFMY